MPVSYTHLDVYKRQELLKFEDKLKPDATIKEGNGNVQSTVAGNENAIGYVSLTFVDNTVKKVNVDRCV